jgi:hypothetical protein
LRARCLGISAGIEYAGLQEGGNFKKYLNSINQDAVGLNYSISVRLQYPWWRHAASGLTAQKKANRNQAYLRALNLPRSHLFVHSNNDAND